jgi:phage shock protein A
MFIRKIFTLFRAYEVEAGQAVIDAHALKILEQELRDAAAGVGDATRELTGLMAREMADRRAHDAADRRAREHDAYALKALEKGDEALARQCAEMVAAAEAERDRYSRNLDAARRHIASLRAGIARADARIGEIRRELLAARSRAALQRATGALAQSSQGVSSALAAAEETLSRINELQTDAADRTAAAELWADEKNGASLREKLSEAGIAEPAPNNADAVLARLKGRLADGTSSVAT